jgi:hypothetical protein
MKQKILRALIFLRLIDDHDGNLSLTNIALIVLLTKFMMGTMVGNFNLKVEDVIGIGVTLASYQAKKAINQRPSRRKHKDSDL